MRKQKIYIADIRSNSNEGRSTGHFIPVAKMYQSIFKDDNQVLVAGGPIYNKYFEKDELCQLPFNVSTTSLKDKFHTMKNCIRLFKEAKGQTIVLQQSSVVTSFIGILLFYHCTSKLFLIQYSNEGLVSSIGKILWPLIKHKVDGIICPTESLGSQFDVPYCVVPDYIYTGNTENVQKKVYEDTIYDFCMLGRISPEKGVVECARKFAGTKYKLIIAGRPQNKELENELKDICSPASNIKLILDYISDEQYHDFLNKSKYAILNYQAEYSVRSSGVIFDMLFNDTPVIGSNCSTLEIIQTKKLGYIYEYLESFDPHLLMNQDKYIEFLKNIGIYKHEHKNYLNKLKSFIIK